MFAPLAAPEDAATAEITIGPYAMEGVVNGDFWLDDVTLAVEPTGNISDFQSSMAAVPIIDSPAIKIDGQIDESQWKKAVILSNFTRDGQAAPNPCELMLMTDRDHLYFAATLWVEKGVKLDDERLTLTLQPNDQRKELSFSPTGTPNPQDGVEASVSTEANRWLVEGRVSLKSLGLSDVTPWYKSLFAGEKRLIDGSKWKANVTRSGKDGVISGWSPSGFGEWIFMKDIPVVRNSLMATTERNITRFTSTLSVSLNQTAGQTVAIEPIVPHGAKAMALGRAQRLISGAQGSVTLPLERHPTTSYWLKVTADGKLISKTFAAPPADYYAIGYDYSRHMSGYSISLPNDMRGFSMFHISRPRPDKGSVRAVLRRQEPVDLVFEVPGGVKVVAAFLNPAGFFKDILTPFEMTRTITRPDGEYSEYVCKLPRTPANAPLQVVFETSLKTGSKGTFNFQSRWSNGESRNWKWISK